MYKVETIPCLKVVVCRSGQTVLHLVNCIETDSPLLQYWENYTAQRVCLVALTIQHGQRLLQLRSVMLLCWSYYKCFALLAGFTQGKRNYSAMLGARLFSLDGYKVRNVWTRLVCGVCVFAVSSGQLHAPVRTGIWRVLFHLATCHRLIHNVPCRPYCSPSRSCTHKQTGKHKLAYAQPHI